MARKLLRKRAYGIDAARSGSNEPEAESGLKPKEKNPWTHVEFPPRTPDKPWAEVLKGYCTTTPRRFLLCDARAYTVHLVAKTVANVYLVNFRRYRIIPSCPMQIKGPCGLPLGIGISVAPFNETNQRRYHPSNQGMTIFTTAPPAWLLTVTATKATCPHLYKGKAVPVTTSHR